MGKVDLRIPLTVETEALKQTNITEDEMAQPIEAASTQAAVAAAGTSAILNESLFGFDLGFRNLEQHSQSYKQFLS